MNWNDRTILLTGGTGSFGKKFCEVMLKKCNPRRLIVYSRDELKQHEMRQAIPDPRLTFFIGDVRDKDRLYRALRADVSIVVHAAALKQVPSCEYNPFEAVKTNILGAQNIIDAAIDCKVERVMALSTDKAVNPINLYGATKLCAEKLIVQGNSYAGGKGTRFGCVRYGNVVGSRGSVIPLFMGQRSSGTITITDRRMTRFWLTLEQGVEFVIKCLDLMRGGEVFVPKIPTMNIMDLAAVIAPECKIKEIGIRPGEKIHETLVAEDESRKTVELDDMFVIHPAHHWWTAEVKTTGKALPEGFRYGSDNNTEQLDRARLSEMISSLG